MRRRLRWCAGRFTPNGNQRSPRRWRSTARAISVKRFTLLRVIAARRRTSSLPTAAAASPITLPASFPTIRRGGVTCTRRGISANASRRFPSIGCRGDCHRAIRFWLRQTTKRTNRYIRIACRHSSARRTARIASRSCCTPVRATTRHTSRRCSSTRSRRSTPRSPATSCASRARTPRPT